MVIDVYKRQVVFQLDIPQIMPVMSALVFSLFIGLAATWTKATVITNVLDLSLLHISGGDQWSVDVNKVFLLEILMNGICDQGTDTEYCLEGVGSWTQMGNGTQVL